MHELAARRNAEAWLRLTLLPGVPPSILRQLLDALGSPERILEMPPRSLAAIAGGEFAQLIAQGPEPALLERTLRWLEVPGHLLLARSDEAYPPRLREIHDPPLVLYVAGSVRMLQGNLLAIVGSRNATVQGRRDAEEFARVLSEAGVTIVSGLALGIDAASHRGGLRGRGSSVAVLGTGADLHYPRRNCALALELEERGAIVSEFPLGTPPLPVHFPRRNRIISGLARGVLVVEAAPGSGSLITTQLAIEQGRDVFAMPGSIHAPLAKGCHKLIKEGAQLVECAEDVLLELGLARATPKAEPGNESECEDPLLETMGFAPMSIDQMAERLGLSAEAIAARLSHLEIEGHISPLPGGWFQRVRAAP